MRKILFVLLALVPAFAHAEDHFGFIGGVNFSSLRGIGDNYDSQAYFFPGVYADFGLSEDLYLSPQVRYMRKGFSFSDTLTAGVFDASFGIKYIELPVLLKYKFPGGNNFRPNLYFGPAFAAKVGDSVTVTNRNSGQSTTLRNIGRGGIRSYDISLEAGGGVEFMMSESMIASFNAAYSYGLVNIDKSGQDKIKTQGILLYVGLGF